MVCLHVDFDVPADDTAPVAEPPVVVDDDVERDDVVSDA